MYEGYVESYNAQKGYGYLVIENDPSKEKIFIHQSALERLNISSLIVGQRVLFEVAPGRKGPQAVALQLM